MQDQHAHERQSHAPTGAVGAEPRITPSSSRMLASYLADIEQLLDEQRSEAALREAFDLPEIAVALADPQLRSSGDRVKAWCHEWIGPRDAHRDTQGSEYERLCDIVCERAERERVSALETVPSLALRRLRLRRLVRTRPRGFSSDRMNLPDPEGTEAVQICTTLIEAGRRWYAHSACHDPTVQSNLARLAVLR